MSRRLFVAVLFFALSVPAAGQVDLGWTPISGGGGPAPLNGEVEAVAYGPDGVLYAGGRFTRAGGRAVSHLAQWAPGGTEWEPVGGGVDGPVFALEVRHGRLYVGGNFGVAGAARSAGVAALDLASGEWEGFDFGRLGDVVDIAVSDDSTLYASAGGGVYRWFETCENRTTGEIFPCWVSVERGQGAVRLSGGAGSSVLVTNAGPSPRGTSGVDIRVWTPTPGGEAKEGTWTPLVGGVAGGALEPVTAFDVGPSGVVVTVGPGGVSRWDGTGWETLGAATRNGERLRTVRVLADGRIVVAGAFSQVGGDAVENLAVWDGERWTSLVPGAPADVRALAHSPGGEVALGGEFFSVGPVGSWNVAAVESGTWAGRGSAFSGPVLDAAVGPDGTVYAVGSFTTAGQVTAHRVARWSPATGAWSPMGDGFGLASDPITVAVDAEGGVLVGGRWLGAGGSETESQRAPIVQWDEGGGVWRADSAGFQLMNELLVVDLAVAPDGRVFATGTIAMESGGESVAVRVPGSTEWIAATMDYGVVLTGMPQAVAAGPDGTVYVGGDFDVFTNPSSGPSPKNVAVLNDSGQWEDVGGGLPGIVRDLAVDTDGRLYVASLPAEDPEAGGASVFAEGTWSRLPEDAWGGAGAPVVFDGIEVDGGVVYLGGSVAGGPGGQFVRMTRDGERSELVAGADGRIAPLAVGADGEVYVGGTFTTVDGQFSPSVAVWRPFGAVATSARPEPEGMLDVAPNPTSGFVRVGVAPLGSGAVTLSVYDAMGREVVAPTDVRAENGDIGFDTAAWAPGVYVLHMTARSQTATRVFTVVR